MNEMIVFTIISVVTTAFTYRFENVQLYLNFEQQRGIAKQSVCGQTALLDRPDSHLSDAGKKLANHASHMHIIPKF